ALGTAASSMAGQNIGAGNWRRVHTIAGHALLYNLAVMLTIGFIVFVSAEVSVKLFIRDAEAVQFASRYLRTMAFFFPFLGVNFVLNGVVRASGAMYQILILNIISFWVLRYPLTAWFASLYGSQGIAYGMGASFVISSI